MTTHPTLRRLSSLLLVIGALLLVTLTVAADGGLLKDINPGTANSFARQYFQVNDVYLFRADDGVHGTELWVTDGTESGTQLFMDIIPGSAASSPYNFVALSNSLLLFTATDGVHGIEFWRTDGTVAGTNMVNDLNVGSGGGGSSQFGLMNGVLYFGGSDGFYNNGLELFRTDGTYEGTYLVKDIYTPPNATINNSNPSKFTLLGSQLFFTATDPSTGTNIWVTDGTTDGTHQVCDLSGDPFNTGPDHLVAVGDWVLFIFKTDGGDTWDLYRTQGGTSCELVMANVGSIADHAVINGTLFFPFYDDIHQNAIWRSDGTVAGTQFAIDLNYPEKLMSAGDKFYFIENNGPGNHNTIFMSDGTPAGTGMVLDLYSQTPACDIAFTGPVYQLLAVNGGRLYFDVKEQTYSPSTGCNDPTHWQIWSTDGTEAGTRMDMDIYPGININYPSEVGFYDGTLIIQGYTTTNGWEPWMLSMEPPPTSVPLSASNLTAQALSATQVQLTWQDNSDNEQGFHIFRGDGVTWSATPLASVGKDVTTYTDTSALCGTRQYYRVMAYNVLGPAITPTNVTFATTPVCVPAAPTSVAAKATSQVRAVVSWKAGALGLCPASGNWVGCRPVQGYTLERKPDGGEWIEIVRLPSRTLSFSDGNLTCNSAYAYRVRATNTSGLSVYSSEVGVTSLACAAPPKPAWVRLTNLYWRGSLLTWQNVDGETSYVVQRARAGGAWQDWTTLDQDKTSLLIPRTTIKYTYRVRSVNAYGESAHATVGSSITIR